MEGKKRLDLFGIRKRSQQRWIEGTLYEAEHRQLPDAYFDLKKTEAPDASQRFCETANFLLGRTIAAYEMPLEEACIKFEEEYSFDMLDDYVKITCRNAEQHAVRNAPLAQAIYASNKEPRYIVKEYDKKIGSVWCEWKPGRKHLIYFLGPEVNDLPDDEIYQKIVSGGDGVILGAVNDCSDRSEEGKL